MKVFAVNLWTWAGMGIRLLVSAAVLAWTVGGARTPQPRAGDLLAPGAWLERLASGFGLAEGPVWQAGRLIVSDVTGNATYTVSGGIRRALSRPSNYANGHRLDAQGRLLQAEHGTRRVTRIEPNGRVTVLADRYRGRRLNSPNDLAVHSGGAIYFTDPTFGLQPPYGPSGGRAELDFAGVYRLDPGTRHLTLLTRELAQPNGIGFSPDRRTLYVSDSASGRITAFPVRGDGTLGPGRLFGRGMDGLTVDAQGRVWATDRSGVTVYAPDGREVATLAAPENTTNVAFGGERGQTLFVTTYSAVYRVETRTTAAGRAR